MNNFVSEGGSSDIGWAFKGEHRRVTGARTPDAYRQRSPSTYATNITTPLLILHSENDLRCPIEQAEHLFIDPAPAQAGRRVRPLPGRGPRALALRLAVHRVQRFEIVLDWFDRYLKS